MKYLRETLQWRWRLWWWRCCWW